MKFKINNRQWYITLVSDNSKTLCREPYEESVCGITHFAESKIYINRTINKDLMRDTIMHELTHAFLFVYGFGQVNMFTEEMVCDCFGAFGVELMSVANKLFDDLNI